MNAPRELLATAIAVHAEGRVCRGACRLGREASDVALCAKLLALRGDDVAAAGEVEIEAREKLVVEVVFRAPAGDVLAAIAPAKRRGHYAVSWPALKSPTQAWLIARAAADAQGEA